MTYNRLDLLKECVSALLNQTNVVSHIVVVNNNSNDGTKEYLDTIKSSQVIIYNLTENLGGAGGFSYGLKQAVEETSDEYFWLMDDDTIVDLKCNEMLTDVAIKLENKFGFLASNVRWKDNTPTNVAEVTDDWPDLIGEGLVKVKTTTFVSFFTSRDNVVKGGLPISEFFIWQDDVEYCLRMNQFGPSYFVKKAIAIHKSNSKPGTFLVQNDTVDRVPRYFYQFRNNMYITKHYRGNKKFRKMIRVNLVDVIRVFVKSKDHRFKRAMAELKGTLSGIGFDPEIRKVGDQVE